jgi:hypothetical protein
MKQSILDQYRKCAETCRTTDYGNPLSVRAHNRSVTKMYKLVKKVAGEGNESVENLAKLLAEPFTCEWLSFQLLDTIDSLRPEIKHKCLEIIQNIANDRTRHSDSFGSRVWLEKWAKKHNPTILP